MPSHNVLLLAQEEEQQLSKARARQAKKQSKRLETQSAASEQAPSIPNQDSAVGLGTPCGSAPEALQQEASPSAIAGAADDPCQESMVDNNLPSSPTLLGTFSDFKEVAAPSTAIADAVPRGALNMASRTAAGILEHSSSQPSAGVGVAGNSNKPDMHPQPRPPPIQATHPMPAAADQGASPPRGGHGAFTCPITRVVMQQPVICRDGYSYERAAIQDWLERKGTSPVTSKPLGSVDCWPNHALKRVINAHCMH